jgi:hypothetical protein
MGTQPDLLCLWSQLHAAWSNGAAFLLCQITAIAYDSTEPEVL